MTTFTVAVVSAGLSQPSSTRLLADQLAGAVRTAAADRGDRVEVITLELRELAHDITDNLLTGFPGVTLQTAIDAVSSADAVIAVTPVFSGSYSGLFKSFFDVLDRDALVGTPVLLAATGGSARHSLVLDYALRPLFAYLKADIVPTGVFAATADFGSDDAGRSLADRIGRAAGELLSRPNPTGNETVRMDADLGPGPTRHRGPAKGDPFQNLVPFEELLARR
jgi:FMN reductase